MNTNWLGACLLVLVLCLTPVPSASGATLALHPVNLSVQACASTDSTGHIVLSYSTDGGGTWTGQVLPMPYDCDRCSSAAVIIDYSGEIAVLFEGWKSNLPLPSSRIYMVSGDGRRFSSPIMLDSSDKATSPQLELDESTGMYRDTVSAAWLVTHTRSDGSKYNEIRYARSRQFEGAKTLQASDRLNFNDSAVYNLRLNVDYLGNIIINWDEPNPNGGSARFIHVSRSSNSGGSDFSSELRIAN